MLAGSGAVTRWLQTSHAANPKARIDREEPHEPGDMTASIVINPARVTELYSVSRTNLPAQPHTGGLAAAVP